MRTSFLTTLLLVTCLMGPVSFAADLAIYPSKPNAIAFPPQDAKYVRFVVSGTNSGGEACLDELEVYGEDPKHNLAAAEEGARATASSCISGHAIHKIEHLNDGAYGNDHSWIAAGAGEEWAQIELPQPAAIAKVVFSRDRLAHYDDRTPTCFEVLLSTDGNQWTSVAKVLGKTGSASGSDGIPNPPAPPQELETTTLSANEDEQLRYAFLAEEHAWLKTHGRADISSALVPYNGRVKEYPKHVEDDRLPLPSLSAPPVLDGRLDDPAWNEASRGVVRVAWPYDFDSAPLATHAVQAGVFENTLYLALSVDKLLSSHLAVLSGPDDAGAGVVVLDKGQLAFKTFVKGKVVTSQALEGACGGHCFEFRLPLDTFTGWKEQGLRIGLGMGGKHTSKLGRPIQFVPSPLSIAETKACLAGAFSVSLRNTSPSTPLALHGTVAELAQGVTLAPGETRTLQLSAEAGPIGPELNLSILEGVSPAYSLHLFRYDAMKKPLTQFQELITRLAAKGLEVSAEQQQLDTLSSLEKRLLEAPEGDAAERNAFLFARMAKRALLLRDPDLQSTKKMLFVKRQPFLPSHNYSDYFDAAFRPGGGIFTLDLPQREGRLAPDEAQATRLFDAGSGIARNPAASFDCQNIYFGYRPSEDGYYHLMRVNSDGTGLTQITDGPFHDFWPCPLPDGGLAFISTRSRCRVFCWRPQTSVLFRMDANGENIRPLSWANVTEWAPSIMNDGRLIWTRWEYVDKGADFGHTLWSIRPGGEHPELIFGNDVIQPNGYMNGREVPGTHEIACTLVSHFGDLNGPIALLDVDQGRFNPKAITSITPEVPWPGAPPAEECFREAYPVANDYFFCSHAPRDRFCLYLLDRYGNREMIYADPEISCMCPTLLQPKTPPTVLADAETPEAEQGEFILSDVYRGLEPAVKRGSVKYLRIVEEVRHQLQAQADGQYPKDHEAFFNFYASPVDKVNGPFGWPAYVAKASLGLVPVEEDGSAHFMAPAGRVLYFEALDENFQEVQRMRSVVQLQPGEKRGCIGCHESRQMAPVLAQRPQARLARAIDAPSWGDGPFAFTKVVQPVLDAHCVRCHGPQHEKEIDLTGTLNEDKAPASYRTLITKGLVHYADCGWNSGGFEKLPPLTFGAVKSKLWDVLSAGHHGVQLSADDMSRINTWIGLNCPLWGDYMDRNLRPISLLAQK